METGLNILKLALCLSLVVVVSCNQPLPQICNKVECPPYQIVESGNGYDIRVYDSTVWMSTGPIPSVSLDQASNIGFKRLFNYIQGQNKNKAKMNMTAPLLIKPEQSANTVVFYVPKKYQSKPPQADGLTAHPGKSTYVAVRQFSGNLSDVTVKNEVAALLASIKNSKWSGPIEKAKGSYLISGYNPPHHTTGRVNEILIPFELK